MVNTILRFFYVVIGAQLLASSVVANDGYFLCTPPDRFIDHTRGLLYGTLQYENLGVSQLAEGTTSAKDAYFALNFKKFPYTIEAHHPNAFFKSGRQVFKSRDLKLVKTVTRTHSGVTLYKTQDPPATWKMIHDSARTLQENLLPRDLNRITNSAAYALVGRRVALVGFPKRVSLELSLCVKQSDLGEGLSADRIRLAFMQLMKDYNDRIASGRSESLMTFTYDSIFHKPLDQHELVSMVNLLSDLFDNQDLVFRSQYGNFLAMGAFLTSTGLLSLRFAMRRANPALSILPPDIIDSFFTVGKTVVYAPEDPEFPFSTIEELFKTNDKKQIIEAIESNPHLEAYLRQLAIVLHRQMKTSDNEI